MMAFCTKPVPTTLNFANFDHVLNVVLFETILYIVKTVKSNKEIISSGQTL